MPLTPDDRNAIETVSRRVDDLIEINKPTQHDRRAIRAVMNGGPDAVAELMGGFVNDQSMRLPVANMVLSAGETLGQKLGRPPTTKTEPPNESDSDRARAKADKRRRIVSAYDENDKLHMMLPQIGRWLPGYAFVPIVIGPGKTRDGKPIPTRQLRDSFEALPGEWTANQAPPDIAFIRRIGTETLKTMIRSGRLNPPDDRAIDKIESLEGRHMRRAASSGGVLLGAEGGPSWANQGGIGVEVYEYLDVAGTWWVIPEVDLLLNFSPNPLKGRPAFRVGKRFAFSSLVGQYDRALGVLAAQARLTMLMIIATEDAVFAPTVITGDLLNKQWRVGRNAVNKLAPGSSAQKLHDRVSFEGFQQMNLLQGELRQATSHPQTEDGISPMSFVTGRGINELASSLNEEVREYQTIIADLLMETDSLMLEYDEKAYGSIERTVTGVDQKAAFTETYIPNKDVKGDYRTRRIYGAMAGLDELNKIAGILNLRADDLIDPDTAMENIDGLENLPQIKERVKANKAEGVLFDLASALGQQGDPRAIQMLTSFLPDGEVKQAIEELFGTPEEAVEEQAAIEQAQGPPPLTGEEDLGGILARITGGPGGGNATVGTQVMG